MRNAKVLVTGAAGFIGSHLCDRLKRENIQVAGVDDFRANNGLRPNIVSSKYNSWNTIRGDCASRELVLEPLAKGHYTHVIHLAADASVPYSVNKPVATDLNNINKSVALLEASRIGNVERFIFASSSAVYGESTTFTPLKQREGEANSATRTSPYAIQKACVEDYCQLYTKQFGLETMVLRLFNVYGPRQRGGGVFPSWFKNIVNNTPIEINGDGSSLRDYVYVDDVVEAMVRSLYSDVPISLFGERAKNVGTGVCVSLNDLYALMPKVAGKEVFAYHTEARQGDVRWTKADTEIFKATFGFVPDANDLFKNLKTTYEWYKGNAT